MPQIENKQHVATLDSFNANVLRLKVSSGAAASSLNALKEQLAALVGSEASAVSESAARHQLLAKIQLDAEKVVRAVASERKIAKRLAADGAQAASSAPSGGGDHSNGSGVPQVLDYVAQKAEMFDLEQVLKTWERKVEIMEMAAKRVKVLKRQQAQQTGTALRG